jgi:hypothetical protein
VASALRAHRQRGGSGAVGAWIATTARREPLRTVQAARRPEPTDQQLLGTEVVEPVDADRLAAADAGPRWRAR